MILSPLAVRAEVTDSSIASLPDAPIDRLSKKGDRPLVDIAFTGPTIGEEFTDEHSQAANSLLGTIRNTDSSVGEVFLEEAPDVTYEIGNVRGSRPTSTTVNDGKSRLGKDTLITVSPRIYEFISTQSEPFILQPPIETETDSTRRRWPEAPTIAQIPPQIGDPELGIIQLREPLLDPELGLIRLRDPRLDPELGILQLRPLPPAVPDPVDPATPPEPQAPPRRPFVFLSTYVSASSSDNVFLRSESRRVGDNFIRPGLSLIAFPSIGPNTFLLASLEANFLRYQDFTDFSYNELRFRAGIRHSFTNRVYGQLSWSTQRLFREGFSDRFFRNDSVELFIGRRDPLLPGLVLDSYYQGQIFLSDPDEFSSFSQALGASLSYRFNPQWDARLGYQLTISDFTEVSRHETSQRITAQLRYSLSPSVRMSLFGGVSYGESSERSVSFDNTFFGISLDATINLF